MIRKGVVFRMSTTKSFSEVFNDTAYKLGGNGKRNIQVLIEALANIDGNLASDIYGRGKLIEDFQDQMADYLGKETAVFFPSGTMAQQIALRIWCDRKGVKRVAYHPLCHLEIHEEDGLKELHHIEPVLLADKNRLIGLEDVQNMPKDIACVLLELPQREIGGQLPDYAELEAISAYCREQGIKLHLDGARLFEIVPYYQKSAAEICALFDSVYVSFYKGIGGIAGAILVGDKDFTNYFKQRVNKMGQYYEEAKELAALFNQCEGISTMPAEPVSNMFHVHFEMPKEQLEPILTRVYVTTGVGLLPYLSNSSESTCYSEVSIGDLYAEVPKDKVKIAFQRLDEEMRVGLG